MFSHMMLGANNIQASKNLYNAILSNMGYKPGIINKKGHCFYIDKRGVRIRIINSIFPFFQDTK